LKGGSRKQRSAQLKRSSIGGSDGDGNEWDSRGSGRTAIMAFKGDDDSIRPF